MGNVLSAYETSEQEVVLPGNSGRIKGLQFDSKARRYAGVPYALPPTGDLRWRKPQAFPESHSYSSSDGAPFDATKFREICPQANYAPVKKPLPAHVYGEDCLRLNIWTPVNSEGSPEGKWPVMLWFHGGWFQIGDPSHEEAMDPTEMISTGKLNAIFVAVGYRLNIFGFLAGDALKEESGDHEVGNYGLWDQRLALEWVYKNISAFGGDPENITLSGGSAGAYAVQAQTLYDFRGSIAESSRGHFRRLVMYSNAIPAQPKTPEECQPQFDEVCMHFGIAPTDSGPEKLQLLRRISSEDLCAVISKLKNHTFRPVTDGIFIHPQMIEYFSDGSFAAEFRKRGLRILIGEVLNEETLYAVTNGPEPNLESLQLQITNYYPASTTTRLLQNYSPPTSDKKNDWGIMFGKLVSDGQVRAPSRFFVQSLVQYGVDVRDIWRYCIAYRLSFITEKIVPMSFGVSHTMDKPFWNFSIKHGPTPGERTLMEDWIRDLAAFVNDEKDYSYGTKEISEYKMITAEGKIEIQTDNRWEELLKLMNVFSGSA